MFACGFCHRSEGTGGPENASLAGLPAAYIVQQMADYKSGARKTSVQKRNIDKTFVAGGFLAAFGTGEKEPIGQRIIEVPEDLEQFENRDPRSQFIAYVPVGSLARGAVLVGAGGAGKTLQCAICHGPDLKGLGNLPSIAGRSPSYVVRQLYDIQSGARAGAGAQLMKATVANLTVEDMASIAAYLASRPR